MSIVPQISVIIPAYNAHGTIGASIQSVLDQSFTDIEILIVDDCSTDDTLKVIKTFENPRIKIIEHTQNKGASAARNTAIKQSQGKYLALLDSDDIWHKDKLKKQYAYMYKEHTRETPASCTSFSVRRMNGKLTNRLLSSEKSWREELLTICSVSPGSTMMARRDLFFDPDIGLFNEHYSRLEDWDWLLKYVSKYKLGILEDVLTEVRVSGYPHYESVKASAETLFNEHKETIKTRYNTEKVNFFESSLQIENACAAFRCKKPLLALGHIIQATFKSQARMVKLLQRLIKKTLDGDHDGIKI